MIEVDIGELLRIIGQQTVTIEKLNQVIRELRNGKEKESEKRG